MLFEIEKEGLVNARLVTHCELVESERWFSVAFYFPSNRCFCVDFRRKEEAEKLLSKFKDHCDWL